MAGVPESLRTICSPYERPEEGASAMLSFNDQTRLFQVAFNVFVERAAPSSRSFGDCEHVKRTRRPRPPGRSAWNPPPGAGRKEQRFMGWKREEMKRRGGKGGDGAKEGPVNEVPGTPRTSDEAWVENPRWRKWLHPSVSLHPSIHHPRGTITPPTG